MSAQVVYIQFRIISYKQFTNNNNICTVGTTEL